MIINGCSHCGGKIKRTHGNQKFCTPECKQDYTKEYLKNYHKKRYSGGASKKNSKFSRDVYIVFVYGCLPMKAFDTIEKAEDYKRSIGYEPGADSHPGLAEYPLDSIKIQLMEVQ